jgi:dynein heavy chain
MSIIIILILFQGLKVVDLQQSDYMRTMESAIQFGLPVLLQNVQEKLDPSLDPILNKSLIFINDLVRMGFNEGFSFYLISSMI